MKKIIEVTRTNVTPKQFYSYCSKRLRSKGCNLEAYLPDFSIWSNPSDREKEKTHMNDHEDWDQPLLEVVKIMPYDFHLFLEKTYNIILEFEFWDKKTGNGYCYIAN